jgi:hypothetical protein
MAQGSISFLRSVCVSPYSTGMLAVKGGRSRLLMFDDSFTKTQSTTKKHRMRKKVNDDNSASTVLGDGVGDVARREAGERHSTLRDLFGGRRTGTQIEKSWQSTIQRTIAVAHTPTQIDGRFGASQSTIA